VLRLSTARKVADVLWPEFVERDGVVLLAFVRPPEPPPGSHATLTDYERLHGHTHVQDVFRWDVPRTYDPEWGTERPDAASPAFAEAWAVAQLMGRMWLAKLTADFPGYRFRVYVTKLDDPIVHFHRVREGERAWITDDAAAAQIAEGTLVLLDSGERRARPSPPAL
jgi:hypothetical protein